MTKSTASIAADTVARACYSFLKARRERQDKEWEEKIQSRMKERLLPSWFGIGPRNLTREEADKALRVRNPGDITSERDWLELRGSYQASLVEKLLKTALIARDSARGGNGWVTVTTEDVDNLADHWPV